MSVVKLFDSWTFGCELPAPFDSYTGNNCFTGISSKFCTQPNPKATLHAASLQAILSYMELESPTGTKKPEELGAIGSQANDHTIAEYPSRTGELHVVVFNRLNGKFHAGRYTVPPDIDNPKNYIIKESNNSGVALLFALMPTALLEDEFHEHYQFLKGHRDNNYSDLLKAAETAAILCDNLYRRIRYGDHLASDNLSLTIAANGSIPILRPLSIQRGTYAPTNILYGQFQVLASTASTVSRASISKNDFVDKYLLSESRVLTPDEELTVPKLPDWYIIPDEIKQICEHAKLTTGTVQPMRNFLLRGPAGTGKTEGAKAIAAALHLPYRCITCSANSEIFDLLGQILPDVNEKKEMPCIAYPTFQDIMLDPATAYQKMTGIYEPTISVEDVYQKLIESISNNVQDHSSGDAQQKFKYVDTPLVEAIRYGYLIEIQEPTVISNPGVLVGLNSLLDRCDSILLPNGEVVKRHPDTVVVVTTNNDYAGCKQMNQSIISRMNLVIDLEEPDEDTLVERVLGITKCQDKAGVRSMARMVKTISKYCKENLITDGCCGVRELISWVQSYMICGDIREAARYTILTSATADKDSQTEVTGCLDINLAA